MKASPQSDQRGFTLISVLLLVVLVVLVYFAARFVSNANDDNQRQAGKLGEAFGSGDTDEGDPSDYEIPDSPSQSRKLDIRSVTVNMEVYHIELVAQLPGHFTGTCRAEVEQPNGEDYHRFVEPIEQADSCTIYVPRTHLENSKTWKFQMSFASDDGKYIGTHPQSSFSL